MKDRVEKIRRKIKFLEKKKEDIDKKHCFNFPFFKDKTLRDIDKRAGMERKKLSFLLKMEVEDLYKELNELEKK